MKILNLTQEKKFLSYSFRTQKPIHSKRNNDETKLKGTTEIVKIFFVFISDFDFEFDFLIAIVMVLLLLVMVLLLLVIVVSSLIVVAGTSKSVALVFVV